MKNQNLFHHLRSMHSAGEARPLPWHTGQRRLTRRHFLEMGGGAAAAFLLGGCGEDSPASPTPGPGAAYSATPGGSEGLFPEPPTIRSANGRLETTLVVAPTMVPHGTGSRWALAVNGTSPGPTLRVRPGDQLRIRLDNQSGHATNIHTHGLRVSPEGNADNPFIEIPAGETFDYEIDIPADHPGGLFWYHPHLHHHVAEQLFAGFFGAIIVEDTFDSLPEIEAAHERLLLIHDAKPGATESAVMSATAMEQMNGREGSVVLVNGVATPQIAATVGQLERWRILNASPSRFYELSLRGQSLMVVGSDGGRLSEASPQDTIRIVPGERVEVLIWPEKPGNYTLETLAVDRGTAGMGMGRQATSAGATLARLSVGEGRPASGPPSLRFPPLDDLTGLTPDASRELTFSMQGTNVRIDGRQFDPGRIDIRAPFATVEEWTVRNTSTMDHPFHLHIWPLRVVASSSGAVQPGWKDVVNVPAGGWVRFRVRFDGLRGKTVYHCHILDHEDMGMMGVIEVT